MVSVARLDGPEVGHKLSPTRKERAAEIDSYVLSCVAHVLGRDEHFAACVAKTRDDPDAADELATRYVRAGPGRQAIARLLRVAAGREGRSLLTLALYTSEHTRPALIETALANAGSDSTVWSDEPLEHSRRERDRARYERGATLLARRGAGRCMVCGALGVASGYCASHQVHRWDRDRNRELVTATVRALAESLGFESDGPRARRARRSG